MKKIYTCTTKSFKAGEHFHMRDTGLIAKCLRSLGVESKCIMPLPAHPEDLDLPLIRVEYKKLEDPAWWRSLHIDGVYLYSWGAVKYTLVARAIRKAGIKLAIHMDFGGDLYPIEKVSLYRWLLSFAGNIIRSIHLGYADYISTSPYAAQNFAKSILYGRRIADKIKVMPAPVAPHFKLKSGEQREKKVVVVGRWSDERMDQVKRPQYMMDVARILAEKNPTVKVEIYGRIGNGVQSTYDGLSSEVQERVHLMGYAFNEDLPLVYNRAQVSFCPSYSESTHIASAESMCCGCSVVVPPTPRLRVLQWYTTHESGSIAAEDTPEAMADAILHELKLWEEGKRNPEEISSYWQNIFHADKALKRIFEL